MLSEHSLVQLNRILHSFQIEEYVQASFLLGSRQDFSAGVDLREVAKNPHLVTMLQRMAIICASYQKPLFTFLEGEVSGSAVSLVSNLEYVYATPEAKAVFDSVKRGWVLEAGGSYYLSRMPNAYGRFLVLTGAEIGAAQMCGMGMTRGTVWCDPLDIKEAIYHLCETQLSRKIRSEDLLSLFLNKDLSTDMFSPQIFGQTIRQKVKMTHFQKMCGEEQVKRLTQQAGFRENSHKVLAETNLRRDTVRKANIKYRSTNIVNSKAQTQTSQQAQFINKLLKEVEDRRYVKKDALPGRFPLALIQRCFSANTVEQILANLAKQPKQLADPIIQALKSQPPLSLALNLEQLVRAKGLDYKGCILMEQSVAIRRAQDPDFVARYLEEKPISNVAVDRQRINSYFQPYQSTVKIIQSPLLPIKQYRFESPGVMAWLNQLSYPGNQDQQQRQVKQFILKIGADPQRTDFDMSVIRRTFVQKRENQVRLQQLIDQFIVNRPDSFFQAAANSIKQVNLAQLATEAQSKFFATRAAEGKAAIRKQIQNSMFKKGLLLKLRQALFQYRFKINSKNSIHLKLVSVFQGYDYRLPETKYDIHEALLQKGQFPENATVESLLDMPQIPSPYKEKEQIMRNQIFKKYLQKYSPKSPKHMPESTLYFGQYVENHQTHLQNLQKQLKLGIQFSGKNQAVDLLILNHKNQSLQKLREDVTSLVNKFRAKTYTPPSLTKQAQAPLTDLKKIVKYGLPIVKQMPQNPQLKTIFANCFKYTFENAKHNFKTSTGSPFYVQVFSNQLSLLLSSDFKFLTSVRVLEFIGSKAAGQTLTYQLLGDILEGVKRPSRKRSQIQKSLSFLQQMLLWFSKSKQNVTNYKLRVQALLKNIQGRTGTDQFWKWVQVVSAFISREDQIKRTRKISQFPQLGSSATSMQIASDLAQVQEQAMEVQTEQHEALQQQQILQPHALTFIKELDVLYSQFITGRKDLNPSLKMTDSSELQAFDSLFKYSRAATPQQYLKQKVQAVVRRAFEERAKHEGALNDKQLGAYDFMMSKELAPQQLKKRVLQEIQAERKTVNWFRGQLADENRRKDSEEGYTKEQRLARIVELLAVNDSALRMLSSYLVADQFINTRSKISAELISSTLQRLVRETKLRPVGDLTQNEDKIKAVLKGVEDLRTPGKQSFKSTNLEEGLKVLTKSLSESQAKQNELADDLDAFLKENRII